MERDSGVGEVIPNSTIDSVLIGPAEQTRLDAYMDGCSLQRVNYYRR